jgi:DNA polymerase-3 subunit delta'
VSWQRLRGHEAQMRAFEQVVQRGRLAHAYLFTGPSGIGKRLFAEELAKALLCEARAGELLEACDRCPSCVQIAAGTHPDYFIAGRPEESLELPIAVMREFCQQFALKSARGRGKVGILDDADDLNEESANCFLKTLEEPPPRSVLLLIGTDAERQLPTIVSRCQVVYFQPLTEEAVGDILRAQGLDADSLISRLARMSNGSPGQALALADPALWEFRRRLLHDLVQPSGDTVGLAQAWIRFVEDAGKEAAAQRRRAALVLRLLIQFLTAALTAALGGTPSLAEAEDLRILQQLAQHADTEQILGMLDRCLESALQIERRVQLVLILEALVDSLGSLSRRHARRLEDRSQVSE